MHYKKTIAKNKAISVSGVNSLYDEEKKLN